MKQKKINRFGHSNSSFWIGGKHTVEAALGNSKRKIIKLVLNLKHKNSQLLYNTNIKIEYENDRFFSKIFNNEIPHQGYAALIEKIEENNIKFYLQSNKIFNIIALDGVTDPRNIGSIVRSAVAFGFDALLINKKDFNSKSYLLYKAASGAMENIITLEVANIQNEIKLLKSYNFAIIAMDGNSNDSIYNYIPNLKKLIIFGSESMGIKKTIRSICDNIFQIPINKKIESLNVSNAVAATLSVLDYKKNAHS